MPRPGVFPPTKAARRAAAPPAFSPAPLFSLPHTAAVTVHGGDGYSLCIECGQSTIEGLYKEYSKDNIRLSRCVRDTWSFVVSSTFRPLFLTQLSCPSLIHPGQMRRRSGPSGGVRTHFSRPRSGVASLAGLATHSLQSTTPCQVAMAPGMCVKVTAGSFSRWSGRKCRRTPTDLMA